MTKADQIHVLLARIQELEAAVTPFVRVARIIREMPLDFQTGPIRADTPAREFIPGAWPVWRDFELAESAMAGKELP